MYKVHTLDHAVIVQCSTSPFDGPSARLTASDSANTRRLSASTSRIHPKTGRRGRERGAGPRCWVLSSEALCSMGSGPKTVFPQRTHCRCTVSPACDEDAFDLVWLQRPLIDWSLAAEQFNGSRCLQLRCNDRQVLAVNRPAAAPAPQRVSRTRPQRVLVQSHTVYCSSQWVSEQSD